MDRLAETGEQVATIQSAIALLAPHCYEEQARLVVDVIELDRPSMTNTK